MAWRLFIPLFLFLFGSVDFSFAGGSGPGQGNRLILATYWGEDKVALLDINGEPGHEELWSIDTLKTAGCPKPYDVRADVGGSHAYVSCSGGDKIAVIDVVAQQVQTTITTGLSPRDLQLFDGGKKLLVANSGSDTASVIDVASRAKLYDFPVGTQPYGVAVADDGKTAIVTGWASGDAHVFTLGEKSATERSVVAVGLLPYTVVIPKGSRLAYVAVNTAHSVRAVDVDAGKIVSTIQVGTAPWSLASSPDGQSMLVTNHRSGSLSLLKTGVAPPEGQAAPSFSAGAQADSRGNLIERRAKNVSISANGTIGAFTDLANNQVVVVSLPAGTIQRVIDVGKAPYGIEFIR